MKCHWLLCTRRPPHPDVACRVVVFGRCPSEYSARDIKATAEAWRTARWAVPRIAWKRESCRKSLNIASKRDHRALYAEHSFFPFVRDHFSTVLQHDEKNASSRNGQGGKRERVNELTHKAQCNQTLASYERMPINTMGRFLRPGAERNEFCSESHRIRVPLEAVSWPLYAHPMSVRYPRH